MPATTSTDPVATVAAALADRPDGTTTRALASTTGLSATVVGKALAALDDAGNAVRTPGNGKRRADTWRPAPSDTTTDSTDEATPDTGTDEATTGPDPDPATDTANQPTPAAPDPDPVPDVDTTDQPAPAAPDTDSTADEPVSAPPVAPTSPAPVGSADHMKIVMVAGILGDHPDGVTAADVVTESGLRAQIVGRVLSAMEIAKAATRTATDDEAELWHRTAEADLSTVDLSAVVGWKVCPECGHRTRIRNGVATGRSVATEPGRNADGQATLGKNELRTIVHEFLTAHPGHEFTAGTIAREIGRSSGAVGNALAKLVTAGEATLVREAPMTYTATTDTATAQK
jgi:hypothetical protein